MLPALKEAAPDISPARKIEKPVASRAVTVAMAEEVVPPKDISHTSYPDASKVSAQWGQEEYKVIRLQEMAGLLKGTVLEKHTAMLLAMLLQEDGTLTAERRHDCISGVCYAIGFMGHHICARGTPLIFGDPQVFYCKWKDGKSPQQRFEEAYPKFATEWRVQFAEYMLRMTHCIEAKRPVDRCVQDWNPNEVGRIDKVKRHVPLVRAAIGI